MRLAKGADVHSADGQKLGTLSRVVIDPNTRETTHIVVERGLLSTTSKLIPIDKVNSESGETITLLSSDQQLDDFDDFEDTNYVQVEDTDIPPDEVATSYWYPPVNYAWWRSGMQMTYPPMPVYTLRASQNIPEGTVALEEGARVMSADDKQVGNIEQLIVDPEDHRVTHLVISEGLLFKERKLIPVLWIGSIGEEQIRLSVTSRTLERLPAYQNAG
jgi:uncharacterized protein YrrD